MNDQTEVKYSRVPSGRDKAGRAGIEVGALHAVTAPPPPPISICSLLTMHGFKRVLYMPLPPSPPPPPSPSPQFQFALFWQITDWRGCFTCRYRPHPPPPFPLTPISICSLLTNNGLKRVLYMPLPPPPPPQLPHQPPFQSALFWQCTNSHKGAIYIWTNFITW